LVREEGFDETHQYAWIFQNSDLCFEEVLQAPPLDHNRTSIQQRHIINGLILIFYVIEAFVSMNLIAQ